MSGQGWRLTRPGWAIVASALLLSAIGVACIFATEYSGDQDYPYTRKQVLYLIGSLVAAALVVRVGYHRIAPHAYLIFFVALLLLIPPCVARLAHVSFGGLVPERRHTFRWIQLPGFALQPSEIMKVAYLLALAWYLRYRKNYRTLRGLAIPLLMTVIPMLLIAMEPDLGTTLQMIPLLFVVLYVAGARSGHLALVALAGVLAVPIAWFQIKPYQRVRVSSALMQLDEVRAAIVANPQRYAWLGTPQQALRWANSSGYQLVGSKAALGSGGVFGHGWGSGTYVEYDFLPERINDFVFAIIGHQWGLAGCLTVLACYTVIALAGLQIASATTEPFGRLLAIGVVALVSVQALFNIAETTGLMPITGMTLPFVSYGGSSLLTSCVAIALLVSVARHRPFLLADKPFEYDVLIPPDEPLRPQRL